MAARKTSPPARVAPKKRPAAPPKVARRPRAAKPTANPGADATPTSAAPTAEQIRLRAYFLSLEHRGRPADPVADWVRAEQELTSATRES